MNRVFLGLWGYQLTFLALVYQETALRIDNSIPKAQTSRRPGTALREIVYRQGQR